MKKGVVKFFDVTKGFGFIIEDETGEEIFVHHTGVLTKPIAQDDNVSFEITQGKKGLNAVKVQRI